MSLPITEVTYYRCADGTEFDSLKKAQEYTEECLSEEIVNDKYPHSFQIGEKLLLRNDIEPGFSYYCPDLLYFEELLEVIGEDIEISWRSLGGFSKKKARYVTNILHTKVLKISDNLGEVYEEDTGDKHSFQGSTMRYLKKYDGD